MKIVKKNDIIKNQFFEKTNNINIYKNNNNGKKNNNVIKSIDNEEIDNFNYNKIKTATVLSLNIDLFNNNEKKNNNDYLIIDKRKSFVDVDTIKKILEENNNLLNISDLKKNKNITNDNIEIKQINLIPFNTKIENGNFEEEEEEKEEENNEIEDLKNYDLPLQITENLKLKMNNKKNNNYNNNDYENIINFDSSSSSLSLNNSNENEKNIYKENNIENNEIKYLKSNKKLTIISEEKNLTKKYEDKFTLIENNKNENDKKENEINDKYENEKKQKEEKKELTDKDNTKELLESLNENFHNNKRFNTVKYPSKFFENKKEENINLTNNKKNNINNIPNLILHSENEENNELFLNSERIYNIDNEINEILKKKILSKIVLNY